MLPDQESVVGDFRILPRIPSPTCPLNYMPNSAEMKTTRLFRDDLNSLLHFSFIYTQVSVLPFCNCGWRSYNLKFSQHVKLKYHGQDMITFTNISLVTVAADYLVFNFSSRSCGTVHFKSSSCRKTQKCLSMTSSSRVEIFNKC